MSGLSFFQPNPVLPAVPGLRDAPPHSPRYPDCVCADCVRRAVDERGRSLVFSNLFPESLGGFRRSTPTPWSAWTPPITGASASSTGYGAGCVRRTSGALWCSRSGRASSSDKAYAHLPSFSVTFWRGLPAFLQLAGLPA